MKECLSKLFACWSADLAAERDRRAWDVKRIMSVLQVTKNNEEYMRLAADLKRHELVFKIIPIAMEYRETEMGREMHRRRQKMEREVADLDVVLARGGRGAAERRLMEAEAKLERFNQLEANKGWEMVMARMD